MLGLHCLLTSDQLIMNVSKAGHSDGMIRDPHTHYQTILYIYIMGRVGSKEECFEKTLKIR